MATEIRESTPAAAAAIDSGSKEPMQAAGEGLSPCSNCNPSGAPIRDQGRVIKAKARTYCPSVLENDWARPKVEMTKLFMAHNQLTQGGKGGMVVAGRMVPHLPQLQ